MAIQHPIPIDILRQLIRLDPDTGRLYWLHRAEHWFNEGVQTKAHSAAIWNGKFAGKEAMPWSDHRGCRSGAIFNRNYLASHVSFALHHGRWPEKGIDHDDVDPGNNRPPNLREATQQENCRNQRPRAGTSPYKGVSWAKKKGKWVAMGRNAVGKQTFIGHYTSDEDAAVAYDAFAVREHGAFARLNFP